MLGFSGCTRRAKRSVCEAQHFLNFLPLPQGQGSLRPILVLRMGWFTRACAFLFNNISKQTCASAAFTYNGSAGDCQWPLTVGPLARLPVGPLGGGPKFFRIFSRLRFMGYGQINLLFTVNLCPSRNRIIWSRSRRAENLTAGIWLIFRGLNFSCNADIGQISHFWMGTNLPGGLKFYRR
jgi:hypothetical protein